MVGVQDRSTTGTVFQVKTAPFVVFPWLQSLAPSVGYTSPTSQDVENALLVIIDRNSRSTIGPTTTTQEEWLRKGR